MILKQTYERPEIHAGWEDVYRHSPLQDAFNARILQRTLGYLRPAGDALFLDAGCGVGYHSLAIARHGYRCVGVDISETILRQANLSAVRAGLAARVTFRPESLENLSFNDDTFDVVHCRGVLMHVPAWEQALEQLCRVLKPGGKIVLFESNTAALETCLVRVLRTLRQTRSNMVSTPGGLEFWAEQDGQPVVTRVANLRYLQARLHSHGVKPIKRFASEFCDINRFATGPRRNLVIRFNRWWFDWRLPYVLSMGNAIIGQKIGPGAA
jgi:ubiquinone/menaquinone biosynthesis C-methylase UbiE